MKIQFKIAFLFTILCTAVIVILSSAIYYFANANAFQDFFTRLELRANIAARANLLTGEENAVAYETIRNQHLQLLPEEKEYIIKTDTLNRFKQMRLAKELPADFLNDISTKKKATFRKDYNFYEGIYFTGAKGDFIIIISAQNVYARQFLSNLRTVLIIGCMVCMVIVFSIGLVFSRHILLPIRNMTREVKKIKATNLHKRLLLKPGKDEISDLAQTFNNMISRLEMAFESQHNFVSNASHELNTPLTALIGEADFALSKPHTDEQYRQTIQSVLKQAEKVRDITKGLLELARSGLIENFSMDKVRMDEIIYDVQKIARQVYPKSIITVDYSLFPDDTDKLIILANGHLIELAISNIVLNACKYSQGKPVVVALAVSGKEVIVMVKDHGIGIPDKDMAHIFDPFFRASNVKGTQGYGIGLPLTDNILRIHKGSIEINSKENEGTEVVVKIPIYIK